LTINGKRYLTPSIKSVNLCLMFFDKFVIESEKRCFML